MVKNIVIVSPIDHIEQCYFLLNSIDQYLENFNVYLIDNTPVPCIPEYHLKNNNLKQLVWTDLIKSRKIKEDQKNYYDHGWHVQQLLKLGAYQLFDNESYVCLDTSCVVLRPLDTWPRELHPSSPRPREPFYTFYQTVCNLFDLKNPAVIAAQVPYILDARVVATLINQWEDWDCFQRWFGSFKCPSEFYLYDLWSQKTKTTNYIKSADHYHVGLVSIYNMNNWLTRVLADPKDRTDNTVAIIHRNVWTHDKFAEYRQDPNLIHILRKDSV
jgi:hypothetical protein